MRNLEEFDPKLDAEINQLPSPPSISPAASERQTASPELPQGIERRRPVLDRFYSNPDTRSPGRQKFRLPNGEKRRVKDTTNLSITEDKDGRHINQYQIMGFISNGRYGKVWLALDSSTGQQVAVKEYSKQDILKANRKKLMQLRRHNQRATAPDLIAHEVAIMRKIDHPNLVELIEVIEDPHSDSLYMIMEWCAHGRLPTNGELDEEQCRLYFRDIILAVEYLHSQGISHRDIKVENVLLGEGDVVKLADFGVSEILNSVDDDQLNSCVGSPAYYAPELAELAHGGTKSGDLKVVSGRKTDIWAMGVTLYYMFHGHLPFQTDSLADLYRDICNQDLSMRTGISAAFENVLGRLMEKDDKARISMAELRSHPWITRQGTDPLLSAEENTSEMTTITEEDLMNAIERTDSSVDPQVMASRLQQNHGWRGASGSATPHTPEGAKNAEINVEKLVRALNEVVRLNEWEK